jgi:hypothetical protein
MGCTTNHRNVPFVVSPSAAGSGIIRVFCVLQVFTYEEDDAVGTRGQEILQWLMYAPGGIFNLYLRSAYFSD